MSSSRFQFVALVILIASYSIASNPTPFVNQPLVPSAAAPGGPSFSLTLNGTGFVPGAVVKWNGSPRTTTFVSGSQLQTTVLGTDIASAGTAQITVSNPAPGGGLSNAVFLPVSTPSASVSFGETDIVFGVNPVAVMVGDFNGDQKMDLAVLDSECNQNGCQPSGAVDILLGQGNGTFSAPLQSLAGYFPRAMTIGDFNGDGKMDVAVAHHDCSVLPCIGDVAILLGNGDGSFKPLTNFRVDNTPIAVMAADLNADGFLDIVTTDQANGGAVLLGKGNGKFRSRKIYRYKKKLYPNGMAIGDFNRDGHLDVAHNKFCSTQLCGPTGVEVWLGLGDGTFPGPPVYSPAPGPGEELATADFNHDGLLDLAVTGCTGGDCRQGLLSIQLGDGTGRFQQGFYHSESETLIGIGLGDFNSDGKLDLAVSDALLALFLGDGNGSFQPGGRFGNQSSRTSANADFNGDGRLDFAATTAFGVAVLIQN